MSEVKTQDIKLQTETREAIEFIELLKSLTNDEKNQVKNDIESFICRIENSMIRRMLEYRYMEAMKWSEVAKKMGKTYTPDYCRVTCDRFLKGYNK